MTHSIETRKKVLELIATDHTLEEVANSTGVDNTTIYRWMQENPEFAEAMAQARESQADSIAERIRIIASKVEAGELLPEQGKVSANLLQWLAAKRKPKVYGDKMTLAGDAENPLFQLGKRMDALRERREKRLTAPVIDITPVKVENPGVKHPGEQFA